MAYISSNLYLLSTSPSGVNRWQYSTTDLIATVTGAGYLADGALRGMKPGDFIDVVIFTTYDATDGQFSGFSSYNLCYAASISGVTATAAAIQTGGSSPIIAATSLALGGATIGSNALAVTGTANISGNVTATSLALGGATIGSNALAVTGTANISENVTATSFTSGSWIQSQGGTFYNRSNTAQYLFGTSDDLVLTRDAANTLAQVNGTNPNTFRVYNTSSSSNANYERGVFDWTTTANVLSIGTENAGTGTARNLKFVVGGVNKLDYGVTRAGWNINDNLAINNPCIFYSYTTHSNVIAFSNATRLYGTTDGNFRVTNSAQNDFNLFQLGGTTSSFPALKRSTTYLQGRLADDSAYCNVQGKLTTDTNYSSGTFTATGYLTLYDAAGTAYRVPCAV
jgi:hypothetical protein